MPYAITLAIDEESAGRIRELWRLLRDRRIADDAVQLGYRPHVTLAVCEALDEQPMIDVLGQFAAGRRGLPLRFAGIGIFTGARPVLWAAPVPSPELLQLHRALLDVLPAAPHPHHRIESWTPHCTLAMNVDPSRLADGLAAVMERWQPLDARLDGLDFVRFPPPAILWTAKLP